MRASAFLTVLVVCVQCLLLPAPTFSTDAGCVGCRKLIPEGELRHRRIEEVKRQILRKLRMEHSPSVNIRLSSLPAPLYEGEVLPPPHPTPSSNDADDFYGSTEQVIWIADEDILQCYGRRAQPSRCFRFRLGDEIKDKQVKSAELWVYKMTDRRDDRNQTFIVTEMNERHTRDRDANHILLHQKTGNTVARRETNVREGWIKFDVTPVVTRWTRNNLHRARLDVSCNTCLDVDQSPIATNLGRRPFIVIQTSGLDRSRSRRSVDCNPGSTSCCRERLNVNFTEIGWGNWILQPLVYPAYFCTGSCYDDATFTVSTSNHATVIKQYQRTQKEQDKRLLPVPCCAPLKMSSLSLIYMNNGGSSILHKNLPNMVVDACGCS